VIRRNVLTNFPLLPRVLKKLAHAIDDRRFRKMLTRVEHGEKPRNVGKDFLMRKKII
jgi:glycine betaine/choline ABC-type transport system substrate-binding protein